MTRKRSIPKSMSKNKTTRKSNRRHKIRSTRVHRKTQRGGMKREAEQPEEQPEEHPEEHPEELEHPECYPPDLEVVDFIEDELNEITKKMNSFQPNRDACFHTTKSALTILKRGIKNLKPDFQKFLYPIFLEVVGEFIKSRDQFPEVEDVVIDRLNNLFYQLMNKEDLKNLYRVLVRDLDISGNSFLTDIGNNSNYGVTLNSYIYKLLTGLGTQYTTTEAVLNYEKGPTIPFTGGSAQSSGMYKKHEIRPNDVVFSDLRNLCLLLRDTLGMVNFLFSAAWPTQLPGVDISDTQYCHSGGNIFYLISMMLCYLHRHKDIPIYNVDILEQIRYEFDSELGTEKDEFYKYLDAFMENPTCRELIMKNTLSISDVDFLLLTSNEDLLKEKRMEMKNVTVMVAGQVLAECCKGLPHTPGLHTDNIALKVVLPKRKEYTSDWSPFKVSDFTDTPHVLKDMINRLEKAKLCGVRITASDIKELHILLVRIKVAIDTGVPLTDEFKRIFAEKLDFVIGSLDSEFYLDKQIQFSASNYYSLNTFFNELLKMISGMKDDKTTKRMDRYALTNIFLLIEKFAVKGERPNVVVEEAVRQCRELRKETQIEAGGGGGIVRKNWFNLIMCIIFKNIDPTTKNRCTVETIKHSTTTLMFQSVLSSIIKPQEVLAERVPGAANAEVLAERVHRAAYEEASDLLVEAEHTYEEVEGRIKAEIAIKTKELEEGLVQKRFVRPRTRSLPRSSKPLVRQRSKSEERTRPPMVNDP